MQEWVRSSGARLVVVFEGRDALREDAQSWPGAAR
jgi:polyphosphate kinase 2 (PPK2 family)